MSSSGPTLNLTSFHSFLDDDSFFVPEMIELVALILGRKGYEVEGAVGGKEGLEAMEHNPLDLILLDLMMPDVDGWEVYRQIKAKEGWKERPVVIITAKAQDIDRVLHAARVTRDPSGMP